MSPDLSVPGEAIGAVLGGRYRLLRLIGEGGLATVYEAEGLLGQGLRAIKLLQPQFLSNRRVVERFYAEARTCHALRHPNIVAVLEFDYAQDNVPYLVMELLVGLSLEDHLRANPPLSPSDAAPLVIDALAALSVAHAAGIIHRDIKPPNLFVVTAPDGSRSLKVLDFGIAKVMDEAGGMSRKTRTGAVLGTPGYMSAEQLKDAKSCDFRSDLWSLAVVFYEMLTHRHPYGDDDQMARAVGILRDPPRPIHEVAPQLAAWNEFFCQALARAPADRMPSAHAMAEQIAKLVGGASRERLFKPGTARSSDGAADGTVSAPHAVKPSRGGATLSSFPTTVYADTAVAGSGAAPWNNGSGGYVPSIQVVTAAAHEPLSVVWWLALLIGLGSFASGGLLGYLLAP